MRFRNLHVQISRIIPKPNKSHTSCIIQIVPCKTAISILWLLYFHTSKVYVFVHFFDSRRTIPYWNANSSKKLMLLLSCSFPSLIRQLASLNILMLMELGKIFKKHESLLSSHPFKSSYEDLLSLINTSKLL